MSRYKHTIMDEQGNWIKSNGNAIHPQLIKPLVKHREAILCSIETKVGKLQVQIDKAKTDVLHFIQKHREYLANITDVDLDKMSGNITLSNFAGTFRVMFKMSKVQEYDEQIHAAKVIIDELLNEWSDPSHINVKTIIKTHFDTDSQGNLNRQKISELRTYNIADKRWKKAMDMISDSIIYAGTKQYLMIQRREAKGKKWKSINLNFTSI